MPVKRGKFTVGISSAFRLRWPDRCAFCNSSATMLSESSLAAEFFHRYSRLGFGTKEEKFSVTYPVCDKHKAICDLLDMPSRVGLSTSFLVVAFVATGLWILFDIFVSVFSDFLFIKQSFMASPVIVAAIIAYSSAFICLILCFLRRPVKLHLSKQGQIEIKIRNTQYFSDFIKLNS